MNVRRVERDRPTRVLLVHNALSPYRVPLFRVLSNYPGYEFEFLFSNRVEEGRHWKFKDVGFEYKIAGGPSVLLGRRRFRFWNFSGVNRLKSFDIVVNGAHLNMPELGVFTASRLKRIPSLIWVPTTLVTECDEPAWKNRIKNAIIRRSSAVLVPGEDAADFIRTVTPGISTFVCSNVVDNDLFFPAREQDAAARTGLRSELGLEGQVLLYCGYLIERKGIDVLTNALRHLRDGGRTLSLLTIGEGPQTGTIRKIMDDIGIPYANVPYVDPEDLCKYFALADFAVLPSHRDHWGMVVNEFMAAGIPVICSDGAGAARDMIVSGESGFVFPRGDAAVLSEQLARLVDNPGLKDSMRAAADIVLERFTLETAAKQFIDAVDGTIALSRRDRTGTSVQ